MKFYIVLGLLTTTSFTTAFTGRGLRTLARDSVVRIGTVAASTVSHISKVVVSTPALPDISFDAATNTTGAAGHRHKKHNGTHVAGASDCTEKHHAQMTGAANSTEKHIDHVEGGSNSIDKHHDLATGASNHTAKHHEDATASSNTTAHHHGHKHKANCTSSAAPGATSVGTTAAQLFEERDTAKKHHHHHHHKDNATATATAAAETSTVIPTQVIAKRDAVAAPLTAAEDYLPSVPDLEGAELKPRTSEQDESAFLAKMKRGQSALREAAVRRWVAMHGGSSSSAESI